MLEFLMLNFCILGLTQTWSLPRMLQVGFHGKGLQDGDLRVARTLIHLSPELPMGPTVQPLLSNPWSLLHQNCLDLRQGGWLAPLHPQGKGVTLDLGEVAFFSQSQCRQERG